MEFIHLSYTKPNISYAVSVISQFMNKLTEEHLTTVYRTLRYLKGTPGKGIFFQKSNNKSIEIYSDADWVGSMSDRRSTTGLHLCMG